MTNKARKRYRSGLFVEHVGLIFLQALALLAGVISSLGTAIVAQQPIRLLAAAAITGAVMILATGSTVTILRERRLKSAHYHQTLELQEFGKDVVTRLGKSPDVVFRRGSQAEDDAGGVLG